MLVLILFLTFSCFFFATGAADVTAVRCSAAPIQYRLYMHFTDRKLSNGEMKAAAVKISG